MGGDMSVLVFSNAGHVSNSSLKTVGADTNP